MGTEEFWIPAVLAAAGAGTQYVNQSNANKREQTAETQNILDQQALQQKGAGQANALTKQIAQDNPTAIAGKATGEYVNQLRKNASTAPKGTDFSGSTSALAPVAGASGRYNSGVAQSAQDVSNYGNTMADNMGQIDAAVRQRQNEGLAMQTLGTNLNTLGAQSQTSNFVNTLRAQAAGQANPWATLAGNLLSSAGKNYSFSGGSSVKNPATLYSSKYSGGMNDDGNTGDGYVTQ